MEPARGPEYAVQGPFLNFLRRHIWAISFVAGIVTLTLLRPFLRHIPDPPPVMFALPEYELVDQDGHVFDRQRLAGKVWVASFVFTSCPSTCPAVTRAMLELQQRYEREGLDVRLVSFSVDPDTDTPEVLRRYADSVGADLQRWSFVTGTKAAVVALMEQGFRQGVGAPAVNAQGLRDIAHSVRLAIVDAEGNVRGFYSIEGEGVDEVFHRSVHVLRAGEAGASS